MKTLYLLLFTLFTLSPVRGEGYAWSKFAGKGAGGQTPFLSPSGIALDGSGNLYVTDTFNHTIHKVTSSGVVSTLAGSARVSGGADGAGGQARFDGPVGIAVDRIGNVYVADTGNHTIRKISPQGGVSTLAGSAGAYGMVDGRGGQARFKQPRGLAVDRSGSLYVGDTGNHAIRKITLQGVVSTLVGNQQGSSGSEDGKGDQARVSETWGLAVDGTGNVYVADGWNHTIRKITPDGVVSTLAGTAYQIGSANGAGAQARFNFPVGVAADGSGNVYVVDGYNHTIRKITPAGTVSTIGGTVAVSGGSADGTAGQARFFAPIGIVADASGGLYVADTGNGSIRKGTPGALTAPDLWRQAHFGSPTDTGAAADGSDPDGDGLVNLMEFALGLDPQAPSASPFSLSAAENGTPSLIFSYRRSMAALDAGMSFTLEWSSDPVGPWSKLWAGEGVYSVEGDTQSVWAIFSTSDAGRRFVRLRVSIP